MPAVITYNKKVLCRYGLLRYTGVQINRLSNSKHRAEEQLVRYRACVVNEHDMHEHIFIESVTFVLNFEDFPKAYHSEFRTFSKFIHLFQI
jgi:hypothetical protein